MLVIRLSRTGRNKYPTYRIVAAEQARAATGKFISILGHYNPHTKELVIKTDEISRYLGNGAQPSNSVIKLLAREKVELPKWVELKTRQRAPKKEVIAPAEPVAAATSDEVAPEAETETPVKTEPVESVVATAETNAEATSDNAKPQDQAETADDEAAEVKAAETASDTAAEVAQAAAEPTESAASKKSE